MAEHAFERFRRLRGITQPVSGHGQVQPPEEEAPLSPRALFHQLQSLGVVMTPLPDGRVHCSAPKSVLTPALLDQLRQHKAALAVLVEALHEREALAEEGQSPRMALPPLVAGACRHVDVTMVGDVLWCWRCRQELF